MESPNSQMWGARVSLGLLRPTRRARSNPGLLCLRRSVLRYVMPLSSVKHGCRIPWRQPETGKGACRWREGGFRPFLKCVRAVARLSMVLGKWPAAGISRTQAGIPMAESSTCHEAPSAGRVRVSPLCREIRVRTSSLCRKILGVRLLAAAGSRRRTSPFCRMMERILPLPHRGQGGIGRESGENRPFDGSSERRRSASRRPSKGVSGRDSGGNGE